MRFVALVCACSALLFARAVAARETTARFALVLGNNRPEQADSASLHYADDDAVATDRLLREAGVDSVLLVTLDADSRALYPDLKPAGAPRLAELEAAFERLSARMREARASGRETELLVFYSGHGDVDRGEGYVVLEDGRLTRTLLYELLARSSATRNHVFVDACKSYYLAFEKGPGGQHTPYTSALLAEGVPGALANTGFVLSTSSDRDSHEWERFQAGILSHELRSALRGAADVDLDGRVTYAELGAFLSVANRAIPNERFRPDFLVRPPAGAANTALISWSRESAGLTLKPSNLGHVYVETAQGTRLLDAHPAPGQELFLHLPAERPLFLRQSDESAEIVVTNDAPLEVAALEPRAPEIARRGALHLAFERLFAEPFGEDDVRAFRANSPKTPANAATPVVDRPNSTSGHTFRLVLGTVTIGAAAAGLTLSTLSAVSYFSSADASQVEVAHENERRRTLNLASAACYAVAGAAGITWALSALSSGSEASVSVTNNGAGAALNYVRRF
jgi:hypothetical protein